MHCVPLRTGETPEPRHRTTAAWVVNFLEDRRLLSLGDLLQTLNDPSPQARAYFGQNLAADGTLTVVGVPSAVVGGLQSVGRAYVFNSVTGGLIATLENPTPAANDVFGGSVAMSGSTVAVGACGDDTGGSNAGSVYVFDAITGSLLRTLGNPAPSSGEPFGGSVAISGDTVVVGVPDHGIGAYYHAGSAYVFNATSGTVLRTLDNPTPSYYDLFGSSVAVSGNTVVVGAYYDDTGAQDAGSAYVFSATTGALVATLGNPTPAVDDRFGWSVAVSGGTVVVGAHQDDTGATNAGSAHVFNAATGGLVRTLNHPTPAAYDYFGNSVAVSGSTVVVGAYLNDTGATNAGSAYVFDATTGALTATLSNPAPASDDRFGYSVTVLGSLAVVGTPYHDGTVADCGAAYVFQAGPAAGEILGSMWNDLDHDGIRDAGEPRNPGGRSTWTPTATGSGIPPRRCKRPMPLDVMRSRTWRRALTPSVRSCRPAGTRHALLPERMPSFSRPGRSSRARISATTRTPAVSRAPRGGT